MSLFPYYRFRYFNDPFFFYDPPYFDPWFDFDIFPPPAPITSQSGWYKRQDRLAYSSTNTTSNARSLQQASTPPPPPPPPPPPEKFRVQVDIDGFKPDAIQKRIEGRKLIVEGRHEDHHEERKVTTKQLRETFTLPGDADTTGLTSYVASNNKLVVEVPVRSSQTDRRLTQARNDDRSLVPTDRYRFPSYGNVGSVDDSALQPRIIDRGNNQKQLELTVGVDNYRPEELNVSVKNNELIVRGEHQYQDSNRSERSSFYKSTTLPRGTQVDQLQSHFDDGGQLRIEAPIF